MKIRLTLDISDHLRRAIARQHESPRLSDGKATRQAVLDWIARNVRAAETEAADWLPPEKVTEQEREEAAQAVRYLKAAGWSDTRITGWIITQRARMAEVHSLARVPRGTS